MNKTGRLFKSLRENKQERLDEMPRLPHLTDKIIDELNKKAKSMARRMYGPEGTEYVEVTKGTDGVNFSAELEYDEMDEIADELNKILKCHGFDTYFDAVDSGYWTAWIEPKFMESEEKKVSKTKRLFESLRKNVNESAWYGIDVEAAKADKLKDFLRTNDLYFEPSENGNLIHFEIQVEADDVRDMINSFLKEECNEDTVNETAVYSNGDEVCINKKNSIERFIPADMTADEVVAKFDGIRKHSEGKAWQWLKKVKRAKTIDEDIDIPEYTSDGCPYKEALATLANDENATITKYDEAIKLFNDSEVDSKDAIIERLKHIRDEELEHINELTECSKLLTGEALPKEEEPAPVDVPVEVPAEEVTTEEDIEFVSEALDKEDEVFKLFKDKSFDSYEEIEKYVTEKGYEVTEVYKEGDGFNINLRKEGIEYFIPFESGEGKFCAILDVAEDFNGPLDEKAHRKHKK